MEEIELKFQVPRARRAALLSALRGAPTQRLQAAYFDSADNVLAAAGVALRIRREGRQWVQTVKASGDDGLTRPEHNVPRAGAARAELVPDLALHAGTLAGARLDAALAGHDPAALACRYRTDIRRRARTMRSGGALLELAFDEGSIVAGELRQPVCELEIELKRGPVAALLAQARRQVERHGLWLDTRSKAERGNLLARGDTVAAERKAAPLVLSDETDLATARRAVLANCWDQIAGNASQLASGDFRDEHLHQLRVGLRRLRTALRLFAADEDVPGPLADAAATLFGQLGAARDRAAVGTPLKRELQDALAATGLALAPPDLPGGGGEPDPLACVRALPAQGLLLDLLAELRASGEAPGRSAAGDTGDAPASPRAWFAARLRRWHRQARKDAAGFVTLDDAGRHRLRKRVKRLRYAVEFGASLFGPRRVRRYLEPLRALQERLGALNDVVVALAAFRGPSDDPARVFALGWLAARRDALVAACAPELKAFVKVRSFWKD